MNVLSTRLNTSSSSLLNTKLDDPFYLDDVTETLEMDSLLSWCCSRIQFLNDIYTEKDVKDFHVPSTVFDRASHFILQHAVSFLDNPTVVDIYIDSECSLFRYRIRNLSDSEKLIKLAKSVPDLDLVEVNHYFSEDPLCQYSLPIEKCDFTNCTVYQGRAYLTKSQLLTTLVSVFRLRLRNFITALRAQHQTGFYADVVSEQISSLAKLLADYYIRVIETTSFTTSSSSSYKSSVTDIEDLHRKGGLPLCMDVMMSQLLKTGHLRHDGRLSLGLSLKGCGFGLEDSLQFWRAAMSKKFSSADFEKKYAYNIKHHYGTVGGGKQYGPPSCLKLLDATPRPDYQNTFHGCPWRFMSQPLLLRTLRNRGLSEQAVQKLAKQASIDHFQPACRDYAIEKFGVDKSQFHFEGPHQYAMAIKNEAQSNPSSQNEFDHLIGFDSTPMETDEPQSTPFKLPKSKPCLPLSPPLPSLKSPGKKLLSPGIGSPVSKLPRLKKSIKVSS
ncbi:hypothetical protein GEMRC1_005466 [Eukaryota sp. GEM-RC1]